MNLDNHSQAEVYLNTVFKAAFPNVILDCKSIGIEKSGPRPIYDFLPGRITGNVLDLHFLSNAPPTFSVLDDRILLCLPKYTIGFSIDIIFNTPLLSALKSAIKLRYTPHGWVRFDFALGIRPVILEFPNSAGSLSETLENSISAFTSHLQKDVLENLQRPSSFTPVMRTGMGEIPLRGWSYFLESPSVTASFISSTTCLAKTRT